MPESRGGFVSFGYCPLDCFVGSAGGGGDFPVFQYFGHGVDDKLNPQLVVARRDRCGHRDPLRGHEEMSILRDNPTGRMDIAIVRVAEMIVRGPMEKMCNGLPLWDFGVGRVVEAMVTQSGVPSKPLDAMDVAHELGLVRRHPRQKQRTAHSETVPENPRRRRRYVRA
jgi:hypothetical protein